MATVKLLEQVLENEAWFLDKKTRTISNKGKCVWCNSHTHIEAKVFFLAPTSGGLKMIGPGIPGPSSVMGELKVTPCDCKEKGRKSLAEAKVGEIPAGFLPREAGEKFGVYHRIARGTIFVSRARVYSSDAHHVWDVDVRCEGVITDAERREGFLLEPGESVLMKDISVRTLPGDIYEYRDRDVVVYNKEGFPYAEAIINGKRYNYRIPRIS